VLVLVTSRTAPISCWCATWLLASPSSIWLVKAGAADGERKSDGSADRSFAQQVVLSMQQHKYTAHCPRSDKHTFCASATHINMPT
jgi:hypothetical protein